MINNHNDNDNKLILILPQVHQKTKWKRSISNWISVQSIGAFYPDF